MLRYCHTFETCTIDCILPKQTDSGERFVVRHAQHRGTTLQADRIGNEFHDHAADQETMACLNPSSTAAVSKLLHFLTWSPLPNGTPSLSWLPQQNASGRCKQTRVLTRCARPEHRTMVAVISTDCCMICSPPRFGLAPYATKRCLAL